MSTPGISDAEILERFARVVANSLRIDPATVTPEANLADLGAESLDILEITMEAEDEFNILIPQKTILQTAQEIVGDGVLIRDGRLTAQAHDFLVERMPDLNPQEVAPGTTVADLNRLFLRVDAWVRMIRNLLEHSPAECPNCGVRFGKSVAGRLKCRECGTEENLTPGDDLNRRWVEEYVARQTIAGGGTGVTAASAVQSAT